MEQQLGYKEMIAFQVGYVLEKSQNHLQVQWFAKRTTCGPTHVYDLLMQKNINAQSPKRKMHRAKSGGNQAQASRIPPSGANRTCSISPAISSGNIWEILSTRKAP